MNSIQKELLSLKDSEYSVFQCNLVPGVDPESIIGVRVPNIRKLAKKIYKNAELYDINTFFKSLPHTYYDENMLHSVLLCDVKDFENVINLIEQFLPFVDNWAVCDTIIPKIFNKDKVRLMPYIHKWIGSDKVYTVRFGIKMLMTHFLDEDFDNEYLYIPYNSLIKNNNFEQDYYVKMMIAWYYATAFAKKWDETLLFFEQNKFDKWIYNKSIQKALESYRVNDSQKEILRNLRLK